jgi:Na+/H+-translocating membrane pyrophosphatase
MSQEMMIAGGSVWKKEETSLLVKIFFVGNRTQRALVYFCVLLVITVVVTSLTGHFYVAALAFADALDRLSMEALTGLTLALVVVLEVVGMNTTLMALVVGYIYGRRIDDTFQATMVRGLFCF